MNLGIIQLTLTGDPMNNPVYETPEQRIAILQRTVEYYEGLLDYLDDMIPNIGEVISEYNGEEYV